MSLKCNPPPHEGPMLPLHATSCASSSAAAVATSSVAVAGAGAPVDDDNATNSSVYTAGSSVFDCPAADSPAPRKTGTFRQTVKRQIRKLYRSLRRADASNGGDDDRAPPPPPLPRTPYQLPPPPPVSALMPSNLLSSGEGRKATEPPGSCVSTNVSDGNRMQFADSSQLNVSNSNAVTLPASSTRQAVVAASVMARATFQGGKEEDLYSVLSVDAEELRNFYTGIYVVAECEGQRIETSRTNRLEEIQTSFIFYRRNPTKNPIEFKMFANHLTLGQNVLIGQLCLILQPGEPFDGMSVRRSIRERPELRSNGSSGLMFNFLSGTFHTQHLSGV